jgi:hypothetical protein
MAEESPKCSASGADDDILFFFLVPNDVDENSVLEME